MVVSCNRADVFHYDITTAIQDLLNVADDPSYYRVVINLNGATTIEHKIAKCKIANNTCSVTLPNATRDRGTVVGFSDNPTDIDAKYKLGDTITIDKDLLLYVISYQTNTLMINHNDVDYVPLTDYVAEKDTVRD